MPAHLELAQDAIAVRVGGPQLPGAGFVGWRDVFGHIGIICPGRQVSLLEVQG